jgi:hypothetical protein
MWVGMDKVIESKEWDGATMEKSEPMDSTTRYQDGEVGTDGF